MFVHVTFVDVQRERGIISARIERNVFQKIFHNGVQTARADVFAGGVEFHRNFRDTLDCAFVELEQNIIYAQQLAVLERERVFRFRQNAHEVFFRQAFEFDGHGESALQFGNQIFHRRHVERARRDEENEIGFYRAVFRNNRRAFHDRQNIPLHAFSRNVRAAAVAFARYFIDLVNKNNTVVFRAVDRFRFDRVVVNEFFRFFRKCDLKGFFD